MRNLEQELTDFDPACLEVWATFVPSRRPSFRLHQARSQALSVLSTGWSHGSVYRMGSNGFEFVCRKAPEDFDGICSVCAGPTAVPHKPPLYPYRPYYQISSGPRKGLYETGLLCWEKRSGKIVDPPRFMNLCEACRV